MVFNNLFSSKKAETAIGTLIIFIAMVIVAAIAAGVIIQTATSLQNKALITGEKAKQQVGTSLEPLLFYGEDGTDGKLEAFYMKVKLSPGSDSIKLKNLLIDMAMSWDSSDAIYGEKIYARIWYPNCFMQNF